VKDIEENNLPFAKIIFNRVPGLRHPFIAEGPTDEGGYISYEFMPYRTYSISAVKDGYATQEIQFELNSKTKSVTFNLPLTKGIVFGKVKQSGTGTEIENALVVLKNLDDPGDEPKQQARSFGCFIFRHHTNSTACDLLRSRHCEPNLVN